jgi:ppGpp synthetase/RelA/SpoT-type nucleotidyltranferase
MKTLKLTQEETKKLQSQFQYGSDLSRQKAIVKVFNPYGRGTWFLINQDPQDPNYIWAIVDMGNGIDAGSVSLNQLQSIRVNVFGAKLPLEKDRGFNETNALEVFEGLMDKKYFKDGGEIKVKVIEDGLNKKSYKAIYGDSDKDGVPDVDDKDPKNAKITDTVETVKLHEVFDSILKTKEEMRKKMEMVITKLTEIAPKGATIYARTKTPYSILNKLVNKKMYNMKPTVDGDVEGLTDLVGTSVVVNSVDEINKLRDKLDEGYLGKIMERKDYYEKPKDGYMAIHYIINSENVPVEVQLKTKRQKTINESSHNPYKFRNLDSKKLLELTNLADRADRGDAKAKRDFDLITKDPNELEYSLYEDKKRLNKLPS